MSKELKNTKGIEGKGCGKEQKSINNKEVNILKHIHLVGLKSKFIQDIVHTYGFIDMDDG